MHSSGRVIVGTRQSLLALRQVREVIREIRPWVPEVEFIVFPVSTYGDEDRVTSLRDLGATDFFTREVDALLLEGKCRIVIHSAKDLPFTQPIGTVIAAITAGVDRRDAFVMRPGMSVYSLPSQARVATSSWRRVQAIHNLRKDFVAVDIRGTIEERLHQLTTGLVDALVIAEAAIIRLELIDLNRVYLSDKCLAPLQGQLAVVAMAEDEEMLELFAHIDRRQRCHVDE